MEQIIVAILLLGIIFGTLPGWGRAAATILTTIIIFNIALRHYADGFWSSVREEWQALFQAHPRFTTTELVGGEARSKQIFELAKAYRGSHGEGNAEVAPEVRQQIRSILNQFLSDRLATSD